MTCPECGMTNYDWVSKCGRCGHELSTGQSPADNPPEKAPLTVSAPATSQEAEDVRAIVAELEGWGGPVAAATHDQEGAYWIPLEKLAGYRARGNATATDALERLLEQARRTVLDSEEFETHRWYARQRVAADVLASAGNANDLAILREALDLQRSWRGSLDFSDPSRKFSLQVTENLENAISKLEKSENLALQSTTAIQNSAVTTPASPVGDLSQAAEIGDFARVEVLLGQAAVDPNAVNEWGNTALIEAASHGRVEIVRRLLRRGTEIDAVSIGGRTALMCAASKGYREIVEILLEAGASTTAIDLDGSTASSLAHDCGHTDVFEALETARLAEDGTGAAPDFSMPTPVIARFVLGAVLIVVYLGLLVSRWQEHPPPALEDVLGFALILVAPGALLIRDGVRRLREAREDVEEFARSAPERQRPESPGKPTFVLVIRTPPAPDFTRFNETLYMDRAIARFLPQWRDEVPWRFLVHQIPSSAPELGLLVSRYVSGFTLDSARISEFVDTDGQEGVLVQIFDGEVTPSA